MTFIFKIIFYLFAIIFIADKCGARNDETASSKRWNKMKAEFDYEDTFTTDLQNTKRSSWNPYFYNHQWRPIHQSPINQDHFYPNRIQISLDFIHSSDNDYLEAKDILPNFVEGEDEDRSITSSRIGEMEGSAAEFGDSQFAIVPNKANCKPEVRTVKTVHSDDPSVWYIPSCTRLPRCGGCCSDSKLSCEPTEAQIVTIQVVKTQLQGKKLKNLGRENVQAEKHTKCTCKCKIQPENCTSMQSYNKAECSCTCSNSDERQKCLNENADKLWNADTCRCRY